MKGMGKGIEKLEWKHIFFMKAAPHCRIWWGIRDDKAKRLRKDFCSLISKEDIFVEDDVSMQGTIIDGLPVCSPDVLREISCNKRIIVLAENYEDIRKWLIKEGYVEGIDFVDGTSLQKQKAIITTPPPEKTTVQAQDAYRGVHNDRKRYLDEYKEMCRKENFPGQCETLLKGLEETSRSTVSQILARLRSLYTNEKVIYSREESQYVENIRKNFFPNIKEIAPGLYVYKNYILPTKHFEPIVFYYEHGFAMLKEMQIGNKCVIDAGAFVGDSALIIKKYMPEAEIYSFEAKKENYDRLLRTISVNNIQSVHPIHGALGEREEEMTLYISNLEREREASNSFIIDGYCLQAGNVYSEKVQCTTLDSFVEKNHLEVGFIKADIEGAEPMMLKGAEKTIRSQKPTLCIAIYHNLSDFFNIKPWIESLNLGYKFYIFRPVQEYSFMMETVLFAVAEK